MSIILQKMCFFFTFAHSILLHSQVKSSYTLLYIWHAAELKYANEGHIEEGACCYRPHHALAPEVDEQGEDYAQQLCYRVGRDASDGMDGW